MFFLRFCLIQKSLVSLNDFSVFTNWCLRINCRWFDTFANDCSYLAKSAVFQQPGDHNAVTLKIGTVEGGNMRSKLNGDRMNA